MLLYCLLLSQFLRLDWCDPGHWRFKFCTITCCAEFGVGVDFSRWLLLDSHNMNLWHCLNLERLLGAIHKWRLVLLQTTNVLRVYNVLLMHGGWSEGKTVDIRQKWWRHLWTAPYWLSPCLSLALYGSLWLLLWALTGSHCHFLACSGPHWLTIAL